MKLSFTNCYTSLGKNLNENQVNDIFQKTDTHNKDCEIRSVLQYSEDTNRFFQVLEGEKIEVLNYIMTRFKR